MDDVIAVGRPLPRLASVKALGGRKVQLTWNSGSTNVVDLAPALASKRVFKPLRTDDVLFRTMRVSEYGDAIEWSDELDFPAEWLSRLPDSGTDEATPDRTPTRDFHQQ